MRVNHENRTCLQKRLRRAQAKAVMPLIGPLLDAFEALPNDLLSSIEQIADWKAKCEASLDRMRKAMPAVGEWRKAQGWSKRNRVSGRGTVACAACGSGTIHLSMAAYNGHVWGKCTTSGCVSWLE